MRVNKKRFVTLYPECENINLIKDVGMIPFTLYKNHNYDSIIVCYEEYENMPYLGDEVKGLKHKRLKKVTNHSLVDGVLFILFEARKIDILQLYHATSIRNYYWILLYKILNPKGKVYLKFDTEHGIFDNLKLNGFKGKIKKRLLEKCDLLTVEIENLAEELSETWGMKVFYLPNGFYETENSKTIKWENKKNIICSVGRVGTYQKATEILIEAFAIIAERAPEWKLRIVGPIEKEFISVIENYFIRFPQLSSRVLFTGEINNRHVIEAEYEQAKIFCLSSRYESFGIVYVEAMAKGCYVVSSEVDSIYDITANEKYGLICKINDIEHLSSALISAIEQEKKMRNNCILVQKYANDKFSWKTNCKCIDEYLRG